MGRELKDLTVGIIGTGQIGSTVIKELSGFGCRILAYNRHENPDVADLAEYVPLETLYQESDVISSIESEQIGALGLDCIEYEEDIVHKDLHTDILSNRDMAYLRQFKNVIHTQHMAFYTDSAVKSMVYCGVLGLIEMADGKDCATQLC
ncbi:NAD(P)-dependent oxidoreductase [Mediterraneibacter glycyrrhizinilyticus]|uniref:NAD(P)-dependent oxidoreductase n=1 Tax=Mediterraneibacter glycyrrhizinilyticus TaxID=342942 RepID=UPI0025A497DD|nr:NAD(P)-dependent oxidoreductase [Mediterraneibacter glycyrrhizinilyticus]MDM8126059.1 NAD(P)-dependent oxidoreductase [Mediterraneibacter glycyrrhizinilyticus]